MSQAKLSRPALKGSQIRPKFIKLRKLIPKLNNLDLFSRFVKGVSRQLGLGLVGRADLLPPFSRKHKMCGTELWKADILPFSFSHLS